jgi:hypothetical protein
MGSCTHRKDLSAKRHYYYLKFQVLAAASMKITFWDAVPSPCSLVAVDRRFRDDYGLRHQGYDSS